MKHIKTKFLLKHSVSPGAYNYMVEKSKVSKITIPKGEWVPHVLTDSQEFIQGFFFDLDGRKVIIPEPNPSVIYFANAQSFLSTILEVRTKLFQVLQDPNQNADDVKNLIYNFYGNVTNFCSSLSNSLEAFMNSKIPKDFIIPNTERRGKTLNKFQVIRYTGFEDKVKIILFKITNKNFSVSKSHLYDELLKLKKLRDNITHAKSDVDYEVNYYEKLFTQALNFDFIKCIESAKEFINFYEPNLIEKCDCGKQH